MRLLVIGDTHGCTTAFDRLIEAVHLKKDDQLITLGDYIDRGPDSRGMIDRLITLHERAQLIPLRGNHDFMMLEARNGFLQKDEWVRCGGDTTLQSYESADDDWSSHVPEAP